MTNYGPICGKYNLLIVINVNSHPPDSCQTPIHSQGVYRRSFKPNYAFAFIEYFHIISKCIADTADGKRPLRVHWSKPLSMGESALA